MIARSAYQSSERVCGCAGDQDHLFSAVRALRDDGCTEWCSRAARSRGMAQRGSGCIRQSHELHRCFPQAAASCREAPSRRDHTAQVQKTVQPLHAMDKGALQGQRVAVCRRVEWKPDQGPQRWNTALHHARPGPEGPRAHGRQPSSSHQYGDRSPPGGRCDKHPQGDPGRRRHLLQARRRTAVRQEVRRCSKCFSQRRR